MMILLLCINKNGNYYKVAAEAERARPQTVETT